MKYLSILLFLFAIQISVAQVPCPNEDFQVLHFTKTNGFNHNTRDNSAGMFTRIGSSNNFTITNTQDANIFNDVNNLLEYKVIIWSNTSGNNVLTDAQEANMQLYMDNGGSYMGMHAATDTYRNGTWEFYNDSLAGAIVQSGPNHTSNNFNGTMDHIGFSPIVADLDNPWNKREEYYYWELNGGQLSPLINEILRVRSTGNDSYDAPRPMAWTISLPNGARSFYTALGHANWNYELITNTNDQNYNDNQNFQRLMKNAVCWAADNNLGVLPITLEKFEVKALEEYAEIDLQFHSLDVDEVVLQRSLDGTDFEDIQFMNINDGFFEYQFKDPKINNRVYYRIYWQDLDGSENYSSIRTVYFKNPFWRIQNQSASVLIEIPESMLDRPFMVVDAFGRLIHNGTFDASTKIISTNDWTAGTYYIKTNVPGQKALAFTKI